MPLVQPQKKLGVLQHKKLGVLQHPLNPPFLPPPPCIMMYHWKCNSQLDTGASVYESTYHKSNIITLPTCWECTQRLTLANMSSAGNHSDEKALWLE